MAQQQRRHKTKRRRRGRFPGLYKAVSAVLIIAAVAAACAVFFRVGDVTVQGNTRYTAQEIIDVTGVREGDNLFGLNRGKIAREIQARLPYVKTVSVRRLLPDTVSITVTEGEAAAAIDQGGRWWLLGVDGKLLEEAAGPGDCPAVTGVIPLAPAVGTYLATEEAQAGRVARLREFLAAMEDNRLLDKLDSVDLSEDYQVTFVYDGRFTVHLSTALEKGMSYWLERFRASLERSVLAPNQSYTVDISDNKRLRFIPD